MVFEEVKGFQISDYVVFVFVVVTSFLIGVYYATCKKSNTTEEYLMAGREMRIIPTGISTIVSYISAISLLGYSAESYYHNITVCFALLGYVMAALVAAGLFVPLFYPLKLTSVDQYFYLRYKSRSVVYAGIVFQVFFFISANSVVLIGPAIMMESVAAWPFWGTVLGLGLLSTIYTTIGGFAAVIWSDVFQAVIMIGGVLAIVILGTIEVGGVYEVWKIYAEQDRLQVHVNPSLTERSTMWGFSIGFGFLFTIVVGMLQIGVQRYCALPSMNAAKKAVLVTIPWNIAMQSLVYVTGITALAYFTKLGCDPLEGGFITNVNQIIPFYVLNVLQYHAVPGIFVSAVICSCLSNLSSCYSSISALVYEDILIEKVDKLTEEKKALVIKIVCFIVGILSIACSFIVAYVGGTLIKVGVSLTSNALAPFAVLIICGALSRRPNYKGALLGALVSLTLTAWCSIGAQISDVVPSIKPTISYNSSADDPISDGWFYNSTDTDTDTERTTETLIDSVSDEDEPLLIYRLSYLWYLPFGIIAGMSTTFLLCLIPFFRESDVNDVTPELLFPFVRYFLRKQNPNFHKEAELGELGHMSVKNSESDFINT